MKVKGFLENLEHKLVALGCWVVNVEIRESPSLITRGQLLFYLREWCLPLTMIIDCLLNSRVSWEYLIFKHDERGTLSSS